MAWTYGGSPSTSMLDAIRYLIGDTDTNDQLALDGELNYLLAAHSTVAAAAAAACRAIAAKFSRQADKEVDDLKIKASQRAAAYAKRAAELDSADASVLIGVIPSAGGISHADKERVEADADRVRPQFARDEWNNPGGGEDDGGWTGGQYRDL